MIGVVQTRDLLAALLAGKTLDPRKHVRRRRSCTTRPMRWTC